MARAIWKGVLQIGRESLPVRMYAAVEDRKVHFRLLSRHGLSPVHQRIVRKNDGDEVAAADRFKAYAIDAGQAVILRPDELDAIEPKPSRDIAIGRFVPRTAVADPWFDRPYYLGPDQDDDERYFALANALAKREVLGIARWAMRKKRYVGALCEQDGYLTMVTLRRAEQVLTVSGAAAPKSGAADEKEIALAERLVEAIAGDFDPGLWQDEYHDRLCTLIAAKASGKTVRLHPAKPRRETRSLSDQLRDSLSSAKERKVA